MALPRIGSTVYILTFVGGKPRGVTKDTVYMKNDKSFIVEDALSTTVIDEYRVEYSEDQDIGYCSSWHKSLKEVKIALNEYEKNVGKYGNHVHCKLEKQSEDSWHVEIENVVGDFTNHYD